MSGAIGLGQPEWLVGFAEGRQPLASRGVPAERRPTAEVELVRQSLTQETEHSGKDDVGMAQPIVE